MARTLTNGFDEEHLDGRPRDVPPELRGLQRPLLGFAGTIRAERLDVALIEEAVRLRPSFGFAFVGTVVDDTTGSLRLLRSRRSVRFIGLQPRERLPEFIASFDVAIAPYCDSPTNRACSPLKVLDALAMGRPVVLTPRRPDLACLGPGLRCAGDVTSFLKEVDDSLAEGDSPEVIRTRRAGVENETWMRKSEQFEALVQSALAAKSRRTGSR